MAKKPSLKSINRFRFLKNNDQRKEMIQKAPATPLPRQFPVNALSASLHPDRQFVKIADIREWDDNCKSFVFVPDESRGTDHIAYFQAGAYVCLDAKIDGKDVSRPYSISSSPKETLDGSLTLTIKRVPGGVLSNYMLDHGKVGDEMELSGPLGEFVYLPIRDGKTVIGAAGGSGITPFHSFAKAIAEGDEDFNLILLYGSRTENDILFKEEFDRIQEITDKVRVVHVLSDEEKPGYEHGFISADLIKKYAPEDDYSIFMCGPAGMYAFLDREIGKLRLERKWIRHELQGEIHEPKTLADYPKDREVESVVSMTVVRCGEETSFPVSTEDTILQSLEKHGVAAPAHCRSGECGYCHSLLLKGDVYSPKQMEHRREADFRFGYVHPCCTFPLTDITIDVPPVK